MIYEILIRGKADGTISGSHAIDFDANGQPGLPRPIGAKDWPDFAANINTALLATGDAVESKQAELDALTQAHLATLDAITAAVNDEGTPTDTAVLAIAAQAKTDATKDDVQKQKDALTQEIAEAQKKLESLG